MDDPFEDEKPSSDVNGIKWSRLKQKRVGSPRQEGKKHLCGVKGDGRIKRRANTPRRRRLNDTTNIVMNDNCREKRKESSITIVEKFMKKKVACSIL